MPPFSGLDMFTSDGPIAFLEAGRDVAVVARQHVQRFVHRAVAHQIADRAVLHQARRIEIPAVGDPDQIGNARRRIETGYPVRAPG